MKAGVALVDADERIRLMNDELSFAEAELGSSATQDLKDTLVNVRRYMGEAFQLNQLNVDDIPDAPDELRTRNARIVQICEWAMGLLEEKSSVLEEAVAVVRQTPAVLEGVKRDSERLRARIPDAQASIDRLALRYSDAALHQVGDNPAEAAQLLTFAEHSADVSLRRREAGQNEQSRLALEASTEAVRRVHTLLDAVENYEIEALRAESTLAAVIADSRGDLVAARDVPRSQEVEDAAKRLTDALASLPPAGSAPIRLRRCRASGLRIPGSTRRSQRRGTGPRVPSLRRGRSVPRSTTRIGRSPSRTTSSPGTADGSARRHAPALRKPSASGTSSSAIGAARMSVSRRLRSLDARARSRARRCSSRSATSMSHDRNSSRATTSGVSPAVAGTRAATAAAVAGVVATWGTSSAACLAGS